jgi:hypothetical protein
LFNSDSLGKFTFDAKVQYNRLQNFEYVFAPVQKEVNKTVKTTRKFLPYLGAGLDTKGAIQAQGGMFFNQDAGFGLQYRYDTRNKESAIGASFLYMF